VIKNAQTIFWLLPQTERFKMRFGITKTNSKVHYFTDDKECICDLHIKLDTFVSKEYAQLSSICKNCIEKFKRINP
jgi:hypothetical protein